MSGLTDKMRLHTRDVNAFFRAIPAAFRTCACECSFTNSAERRVTYAGYRRSKIHIGARKGAATYKVLDGG